MPRRSKAFRHYGAVAVTIPKKLADRIGLVAGDDVTILLNSNTDLRVKRIKPNA